MQVRRSTPRPRSPLRRAALGLAAALCLQACFDATEDTKPDETDDSGQPSSGPDIALSTELVDFGAQAIDSTTAEDLLIDNLGTADLDLDSFELLGSTQAFVLPPYLPQGIVAGNTAYITLRFTPTETGQVEARLIIHSNDPDTPEAEVLLRGEGVAP